MDNIHILGPLSKVYSTIFSFQSVVLLLNCHPHTITAYRSHDQLPPRGYQWEVWWTSPKPIGLTPALLSFVSPLSSGIYLHAIYSVKQSGLTSSEYNTFATSAIAWHNCNEAFPNAFEQRKSFHMSESIIDGPREPFKFLAVFCTVSAVTSSNISRVMWIHRKISPEVDFTPNWHFSLNKLTTTVVVCALNRKCWSKMGSQPHWIFAQLVSSHDQWRQNPQLDPRPLSHIFLKNTRVFFAF